MFHIAWDRYRLVDVSLRVVPGEGGRRLALRRYTFPVDGSFGYEVDTVTHLGTHVEAPAHYYEDGPDVTAYPPELFMGPMVHLRFAQIPPKGEITRAMVQEAAEGLDLRGKIVLVSSPHVRTDPAQDARAALSVEAVRFLVEEGIKLLGFDDSITIDTSAEHAQGVHRALFDHGVLLLEYLGGLDQLRRKEAYLIALPLRVVGFDSSPVRAVVIEEK